MENKYFTCIILYFCDILIVQFQISIILQPQIKWDNTENKVSALNIGNANQTELEIARVFFTELIESSVARRRQSTEQLHFLNK